MNIRVRREPAWMAAALLTFWSCGGDALGLAAGGYPSATNQSMGASHIPLSCSGL